MRPQTLAEVVGQQDATGPDAPLGKLLRSNDSQAAQISMVLWGPPGTGKTTLAMLAAQHTGANFVQLSAVTSGVKEVREVIEGAKNAKELTGRTTVLFIDEIHRFSKAQQDALLPAVENGWVTLIAATTENPSFAVISALLSRSLLVPLFPVGDQDIVEVVNRALTDSRGLGGRFTMAAESIEHIVRLAAGDVRRALTILEAASVGIGSGEITQSDIENAVAHAVPIYDRDGDQHYDVISAFIKSVRGSDVDAALHYLARMLEAGEDPRFVARRMIILASEDIGMADSQALPLAVAAMESVAFIGMPEARIVLGHVVTYLALAPKSNRAYLAIDAAIADVRAGLAGAVPLPLRDSATKSSRSLGAGEGYRYPHDAPGGIVAFQYAPETVAGRRYYQPSGHGREAQVAAVMAELDSHLGKSES